MLRGVFTLLLLLVSGISLAQSVIAGGETEICSGQNTVLRLAGADADSIIWQKDQKDLDGNIKLTLTVAESGSYRVKLKNGKFTNAISITVYPYPVANFTSNFKAGQCSNQTVKFTNTTTDAATYLWSFGDPEAGADSISQAKDPSHTFIGKPGNGNQEFTVNLTAISPGGGCTNKQSMKLNMKQIPDASMGGLAAGKFQGKDYFKVCGNTPQAEFTFTNTTKTSATNIDYKIIWGDGSPDFSATNYESLTHTYKLGTNKLTLVINGKNGCTAKSDYYVFVGTNPSVGLANPGNTAVCSGDSLKFPITETANNVPGTIYTLTFNDGSAPREYVHPNVPTFEMHKFDVTSCGTSSSDGARTYPNSFFASIQAANPCASSSASIVPIYVTEKPKPDFSISPSDTICTNTTVRLTNLSKSNIVDNGLCSHPNAVWKISPATGYAVTGTLGNDFGQSIPSIWQAGSETLNVKFTEPGVYSVTLKTGSDFCGINQKTTTICVNPPPSATFTLDKKEGCAPLTVAAKTTAAAPNCGTLKFKWQVSYLPFADCDLKNEDYQFVSGTNETSQNPVISFHSPGVYSLRLMVMNPGDACYKMLAAQEITVKTKPQIQVTGIQDICANATLSPAVKTACSAPSETTYSWTFYGGTPATSNKAVPGKILYPTPGKYDIKLIATNQCGIETYDTTVHVRPNPQIDLLQDLILCAGTRSKAVLITVNPDSAEVIWNNNNPSIGLASSGNTKNIPSFTAINSSLAPIKAILNVTARLGSCSDSRTMEIIVNPKPAPPQTSDVSYCKTRDTVQLTAGSTPGNLLLWYQNDTAANGSTGAPKQVTSKVGITEYFVSQQNIATGCNSDRAKIKVTVNPIPAITSTTQTNPSTCASPTGSISLSGLSANTSYLVSYNKNSGNAVTTSIRTNSSGVLIISNLTAGDYSNVFVQLNGCSSEMAGPFTLFDPTPPATPSIQSNSEICSGQNLLLEAISSETQDLHYSWTGPNGFSSSEKKPSILNATSANSGKYTLTVTQNLCISATAEAIVIVNGLPQPPKTNAVGYCIDTQSQPLAAISAEGHSLNWYSSNSQGTALPQPPVPATTTAGETLYYVSQTNQKGCESSRTAAPVTVHPNAIANFNPPALMQCPPFTITAKDIQLKQHPLQNSDYRWFANGVYLGSGTDFPGYTLETENQSVRVKLEVSSLFGCKTDTLTKVFSTLKLPRPSFSLSTNEGCAPLAVEVTNTTDDIDSYSYLWSFANGQTMQEAQPGTITFPANPTYNDTIYFVRLMISSICDTLLRELPVHVKSKPNALFTPSSTEGCSPMKVTFKNTSKGLHTRYHWNFGDGNTFDTNFPEDVQHTFHAGTATNFTVTLTATNECGSDTSRFIVSVAPNKIKLNFAMNGPDHSGCEPHTVSFFNNTSGASSFYWDFGDGNFKSTTAGVETITHTYLKPGKYEVKLLAQSSCSDTSTIDYVTVYPKPTANFKADSYTSCIGNRISFTNESNLATSYLWEFGDGNTSTVAQPSHLYTKPGTYTVKLTAYKLNAPGSSCTSVFEQQILVTETLPGSFTMSDSIANCAPLTVTFENEISPATNIVWNLGDGATATGNKIVHTYAFSGSYQPTATVTTSGGCKYVTTKNIVVNGPSGTLQYSTEDNCQPTPVRFEVAAVNTESYEWDFGDGTTIVTTTAVVFHEYRSAGTYLPTVTLKNSSGCSYDIKGTDSLRTDRIDAGFIIEQQKICDRTTAVFTDTSHVFFGMQDIQWNFGDGDTATGKTVKHEYPVSGKYWIEMTPTAKSGCKQTIKREVNIEVFNTPSVSIIADSSACTNKQILFKAIIQSADELNVLNWKISNGVSGIGESLRHTFTQPGRYEVTFIGSTINGCTATAVHTIDIKPSPTVKASADITICTGASVQLAVTEAANYQWAPLQGLSCTNCENPVASPVSSTPFVVTGFNNAGCSASDTVNITVIPPLKMTTSGNDSICIGQSANLMVSGAASYVWSPSHGLSSTVISNPVATPATTTTYRVIGYDGHQCFSDTAYLVVAVGKYPTVDLGPDKVLATGTILPLATTVTEGPVKAWKWTPATDLDCLDCSLPKAHIKKDITYKVEVTNIYGCKTEDTISIKVFCENAQVFIPNAFSPDGDGVNDVLMVRASGIALVKSFRVFNRWGQLVFEKNNFAPNEPAYGWNGKITGKPGPSEVYVYTAEVICENGVSYTYKGNTTLIK